MLTEDTLHAENVPFEKDLAYLLFIDNLCIYGELKIAKMHRTSTVEKREYSEYCSLIV